MALNTNPGSYQRGNPLNNLTGSIGVCRHKLPRDALSKFRLGPVDLISASHGIAPIL
jgi:hypothetical protein